MKKLKIFLMVLLPLIGITANAYDFSITRGAETYSYTITGSNTCELSKCTSTRTILDSTSSGDVKVSSTAEYEGTTFQVTSIGNDAFGGLDKFYKVELPNSVTAMGTGVFQACTNLVSVVLPNSLTSIPDRTFYNCIALGTVNIPETATSIGEQAFAGCYLNLTSITIPNTLTYIGASAFSGCQVLATLTLPNSLTYIGSYAFSNCTKLASIKIPDLVAEIGSYAFQNCTSLTSANIPPYVTSLQSGTFSGCTGLQSLKVYHTNPSKLSIGSQALKSVPVKNCRLYIPVGCKDIYTSHTTWRNFTNITESIQYVTLSMGEPEMATLWIDNKTVIPNGVEVYYAESLIDNGGDAELRLVKIDGNILPARTGVIVKGVNGTTYDFIVSDITGESVESMLVGSSTDTTLGNDGYNYYKLTYGDSSHTPDSFGFYLANYYGTINAKANKAYLKLPQTMNVAKIRISFNGETSGISTISINNSSTTTNDIYNIYGQKVGPDYKGIVIINGKKVIKK